MITLLDATVVGKRPYEFEAEGRTVKGVTYYATYAADGIDGIATGKFNVSDNAIAYNIGDSAVCAIVKGNMQLVK